MPLKKFSDAVIPFKVIDGRRALTGLQMAENPWLEDFYLRYKDDFEHAANMDAVFLKENSGGKL